MVKLNGLFGHDEEDDDELVFELFERAMATASNSAAVEFDCGWV